MLRFRAMPRAFLVVPFVAAGLFGICGTLAFAHHSGANERAGNAAAQAPRTPAGTVTGPAPISGAREEAAASPTLAAFAALPPMRFSNQNTQQVEEVELYDAQGHVNEAAAARLDALLCDTRDPKAYATLTLDRRTLQLAVRAALHFHAREVQVISAYRKPGRRREGLHASGKAIDFKLPNVPARTLAAYLRTLARVGVGVYTHPKTSYVHLDDREHSFYWLDASPPGRTWRELSIADAALPKRDAAYARANDWPEGVPAPPDSSP
jgi:uncharacterized protein YcbK (DUF882 family)